MTQSPFELRHAVLDVLLKRNSADLNQLNNDLPRISNIMKRVDDMISGNFDGVTDSANQTDIPFEEFRAFVADQTINHPMRGPITPEYRDWYDREFAKLFDAYMMEAQLETPTNLRKYAEQPDSYPLVEKYYYPRQCGITTFMMLYAKYMYDQELYGVWMIPMGGNIDAGDREYQCYHADDLLGRKSVMIKQVLLDTRISSNALLQSEWVNHSDAHSIHHYITHEGL